MRCIASEMSRRGICIMCTRETAEPKSDETVKFAFPLEKLADI